MLKAVDRIYIFLNFVVVLIFIVSVIAGVCVVKVQAKRHLVDDAVNAVIIIAPKSFDAISDYGIQTEAVEVEYVPTFADAYASYQLSDADLQAVPYIARTIYGEARGCSYMERAAVVWCILNRVDAGYSDSIVRIITAPNQFVGYRSGNPIRDEDWWLAVDVLTRWRLEQQGWSDVGRVLPKGYLWFGGDGKHNHFRDAYRGGNHWDWSLPNPY